MKYYINNKEYSSLAALTDAMVDIAEVSKLTSHAWEASSMEELMDNLFCIHKAREYAENVAGWFASGEELEFGGLFGTAPIMKVNTSSPAKFISRGGLIPAPLQSLKN